MRLTLKGPMHVDKLHDFTWAKFAVCFVARPSCGICLIVLLELSCGGLGIKLRTACAAGAPDGRTCALANKTPEHRSPKRTQHRDISNTTTLPRSMYRLVRTLPAVRQVHAPGRI